jgi:hypothetical protein
MSDLDILIEVSRSRLVRLEEHLQFEKEKLAKMEKEKLDSAFSGDEKRMGCIQSPLKAIQAIVDQKKIHMTHPSPTFGALDAKFYHRDALSALEPILKMLKKIDERLDALENKN